MNYSGQFQCLGSIQHLKNRFGSGYSLTLRCDKTKLESVKTRMRDLIVQAVLQEEHQTQLKFQLPLHETRLPSVFSNMEQLRRDDLIEDYSITQTTLDEVSANTLLEQLTWFPMFQVFVQFASKQTELLQDEVEQNISIKQKILKKLKPSSV